MWPDRRFMDLVGIEHPIIQAPMAGANGTALAVAVAGAGGLGSLPCGMLGPEQVRTEAEIVRQQTDRPVNFNFFCHEMPAVNAAVIEAWRGRLASYYEEFGIEPDGGGGPMRMPFDAEMCDTVAEFGPRVVSFHYGLPPADQVARLKAAGRVVLSSATTVAEARDLEARGADAIIAQGLEAGGHRGMYLTDDIGAQVGTMALVPQVVDAVDVPVIAAGGIADARGIAACLMLGASAVQIGTAYLFCPESTIGAPYRAALAGAGDDSTVLTNVISGRPARGIVNRLIREMGPIGDGVPPFPLATGPLMPLRRKAEEAGLADFTPLLAGQAAALASRTGAAGAADLTARLAAETLDRLRAAAG